MEVIDSVANVNDSVNRINDGVLDVTGGIEVLASEAGTGGESVHSKDEYIIMSDVRVSASKAEPNTMTCMKHMFDEMMEQMYNELKAVGDRIDRMNVMKENK